MARRTVLAVSLAAVLLATLAPASIFERVLFAWHAVGAAFGPILLIQLAGFRIKPRFVLSSIWVGFGMTVLFHSFENTPGDWLERLVPFFLAAIVAFAGANGGRSRRRPATNTDT
jgi:Na+/proline symporter